MSKTKKEMIAALMQGNELTNFKSYVKTVRELARMSETMLSLLDGKYTIAY